MTITEPTAADLAEASFYFAAVHVDERRKAERRAIAESLVFRMSLVNIAAFVAGIAVAYIAMTK